MPEGETYVPKVCPMQYIVFFILLGCWILQHWVYNSMIKGKLYVADARLIKGHKEPKFDRKALKKKLKEQEKLDEDTPDEVIVEELPVEEATIEVPAEEVKEVPKEETKEAPTDEVKVEAEEPKKSE